MALQLLSHGEPQWDAKVNAAINQINQEWTARMSDGLVYQNGFQERGSGNSYYRYIQFNGWKLVWLQIDITLPSDPASNTGMTAVVLPDAIAYDGFTEWKENKSFQLSLAGSNFSISPDDAAASDGGDFWFGAGAHYVANLVYPHID